MYSALLYRTEFHLANITPNSLTSKLNEHKYLCVFQTTTQQIQLRKIGLSKTVLKVCMLHYFLRIKISNIFYIAKSHSEVNGQK